MLGPVTLIGSGNLATHLGNRLLERGHEVSAIFSRNRSTGRELADSLGAAFLSSLGEINGTGTILICIPETFIAEFTAELPPARGLVIHTSGNSPVDLIDERHPRRGVIWPLQSFSRGRRPDWDNIPLIIEEESSEPGAVEDFAKRISPNIFHYTGLDRSLLHLSAVLVNNFTNALYAEAASLLEQRNLDFSLLLPLIRETAAKVTDMSPVDAQTGPARRSDAGTMQRHLELLAHKPELAELYVLISRLIARQH